MTGKIPPGAPPPMSHDTTNDLLYAGKRPAEMTREEALVAAIAFRDAHVDSTNRMTIMTRRMTKMEERLGKERIAKLDAWLRTHAVDAKRGDGSDLYEPWDK